MRHKLVSLLYRWGKWDIKRLSNLPKITQLVNVGRNLKSQVAWYQNHCVTSQQQKQDSNLKSGCACHYACRFFCSITLFLICCKYRNIYSTLESYSSFLFFWPGMSFTKWTAKSSELFKTLLTVSVTVPVSWSSFLLFPKS